MKKAFQPKSGLEKFGFFIYERLVENFPRTYFVGGTVRDFLLGNKITDIDIATSATPSQSAEILKKYFIECNLGYQAMGVVIATGKPYAATVATFRKDLKSVSRYPKIKFVKSPKEDSIRRDFTINSLYFSPKTNKIFDFHGGLADLKKKRIKFIGQAEKRIKEDPLRILRAMRFALNLNFQLDPRAKKIIKKSFALTKQLTNNKIKNEMNKLKNLPLKKIVNSIISNPKLLDRYF
ncbi:MAG: hypothetical protein AAB410_01355 [Patescibacteria group bacterium]